MCRIFALIAGLLFIFSAVMVSAGGCGVFPCENCQIDYFDIYMINIVIIFVLVFLLIVAFIGYKYVEYLKFKKEIKSGQSTGEVTCEYISLLSTGLANVPYEYGKKNDKTGNMEERKEKKSYKLSETSNDVSEYESPLSKIG